MYKGLIRPILFALSQGDAEKAHLLAKKAMQVMQRSTPLLLCIEYMCKVGDKPPPTELLGITFPSRVGLAAGFDKNAEVLPFLQALGFGFLEIGSVLPEPQAGNPRPRMFRLEEHGSIINRMGFNSDGADAVVQNLEKLSGRLWIPIGISLGKMKETPLEDAADDYVKVKRKLARHSNFLIINISSPNTPGLRQLQGRQYLEALVKSVVVSEKQVRRHRPVLVKIAPDINEAELDETLEAALAGGVAGIVVSNTTTTRPISGPWTPHAQESGGMSGRPVFPLMIEKLRQVRRLDSGIPIIAVGGIDSLARGQQALDEGANLIQILTGLVYEGPGLIRDLRTL